MGWIPAGAGYEVSLSAGKVVARQAGGKQLKRVPAALKDDEAVLGLRQLVEWLARHEATCRAEVEAWLSRSLPVPVGALVAVWPDDAWRDALRDLVIVPVDAADSRWRLGEAGFLREADPARGLGVVNLDGDSVRLSAERFAIPHPVLLEDLEDLREFATELGIRQGTPQLFREIWRKPEEPEALYRAVREHAGGRFEQLRHLTGRAASLGYAVRGGYASRRIWEAGRAVDVRMWVGIGDPSEQTETGELEFTTVDGSVPLAEVGPVAWSEGMRMAAGMYAGRVAEEEDQG
jgi:Domain of unknown function (DUF4132)